MRRFILQTDADRHTPNEAVVVGLLTGLGIIRWGHIAEPHWMKSAI